MSDRQRLEHFFAVAIEAVRGDTALKKYLRVDVGSSHPHELVFSRGSVHLQWTLPPAGGRLRLIALGKAALAMAAGALSVLREANLGTSLDAVLIITKELPARDQLDKEITRAQAQLGVRCQLMQGGHPVADERSLRAGQTLLEWVASSDERDRYLILLSGGASALAVQPVDGISLAAKTAWVQRLMQAGAAIDELNLLRRYLSRLKGGGLARAMAPASHLTLAISDVPGDDPRVIGSAPTLDYAAEPEAVRALFERYGFEPPMDPQASPATLSGVAPQAAYAVIATLDDALEAVCEEGRRLGYRLINRGRVFYGDLDTHVHDFCQALRLQASALSQEGPPYLIVAAGEPRLALSLDPAQSTLGAAAGGRAQHFALLCARELQGVAGVTVLAAGTDGSDGPTSAAGACVDGTTWAAIEAVGIDPQQALDHYRSHPALASVGALLITGATGTNVADLFLGIVRWENRDESDRKIR